MPDTARIVELYDGQVQIKFSAKKHSYQRFTPGDYVIYQDVITGEDVTVNVINPRTWVKIPSVTTIVKPALDKPELYNWLGEVGVNKFYEEIRKGTPLEEAKGAALGARWKIFKEAGTIGTEVHQIIHEYILERLEGNDEAVPRICEVKGIAKQVNTAVRAFMVWQNNNIKEYLHSEFIVYHPFYDVVGTLDITARLNSGALVAIDNKTSSGIYPADVMQVGFYRRAYEIQEQVSLDKILILHLDKAKSVCTPYDGFDSEANSIAFECAKYLISWRDTLKL